MEQLCGKTHTTRECTQYTSAVARTERVKVATGVEPLLKVEFLAAVHLDDPHKYRFNVAKLLDREGQLEAEVRRPLEFHLARIHPRDARTEFRNNNAQRREHAPSAVDKLALAEARKVENLGVRLERLLGHSGGEHLEATFLGTHFVHGIVLLELVNAHLHELHRLGESERVESTIARQRSVKPCWRLGVWQPQLAAELLLT